MVQYRLTNCVLTCLFRSYTGTKIRRCKTMLMLLCFSFRMTTSCLLLCFCMNVKKFSKASLASKWQTQQCVINNHKMDLVPVFQHFLLTLTWLYWRGWPKGFYCVQRRWKKTVLHAAGCTCCLSGLRSFFFLALATILGSVLCTVLCLLNKELHVRIGHLLNAQFSLLDLTLFTMTDKLWHSSTISCHIGM